jgi:S-adenosylmethionine:tRNA ribosyltransferase-isomerase
MQLSDFHYDLPEELIARHPLKERSASRLLCLTEEVGEVVHRQFSDIVDLINPNDLLVCNNSKVIPARLFGEKPTGGKIEILVERILDQNRILALVRSSKSPKTGSKLLFTQGIYFEVLGRKEDLFELSYDGPRSILEVIEELGEIPLPPYMHRSPEEADQERYQTVYADPKGSVAAPTAGLHFDKKILDALKLKGVDIGYLTLHVGSGTFAPVRTNDIAQHHMHAENMEISAQLCEQVRLAKSRGGRVIAVGTTSVRGLETASLSSELKPYIGETTIFIYPGFNFKTVDALLTNFHLPHSTLLMLVSALGGYKQIMAAYQIAVQNKYRFFSYGDAMFIPGVLRVS